MPILPNFAASGNSTKSVQSLYDTVAGEGIPDPRRIPAGYAKNLSLQLAQEVMNQIISERFNWKWNRRNAAPFLTNSWQQDYPQVGLSDLGWLEDCDVVDINNTALPKPRWQITIRKQLSTTSLQPSRPNQICWMPNGLLVYGAWPGAGVVFNTQLAPLTKPNPVMSMIDSNGNTLVLTQVGTTGASAPAAEEGAVEGTTVDDGSCIWTVVDPNNAGFRLFPLPAATGPVLQVTPIYQKNAPAISDLLQLINPVPDDYSHYFLAGLRAKCLQASPNPGDRPRGQQAEQKWLESMAEISKQADREPDAYGLLPARPAVEPTFAYLRNPQDPSQPY